MNLTEKAAYLKGLKDGLKLGTETAEGKLLDAIIDLLGDMAEAITDVEDMSYAVADELDAIEEELDAIEEVLDEEFEEESVYEIVGSTEADPMNNKISDESPIGRALLGKKTGDEVIAETPAGELKLKILGISKVSK